MTMPQQPDSVAYLLAGFLEAEQSGTSMEDVEQRLPYWLNASSLWFRSNEGPAPVVVHPDGPPPPRWITPRHSTPETQAMLSAVGRRWLAAALMPPDHLLRVRVDTIEDADRLVAGCGDVVGLRVAPFVERWPPFFAWQWPLRIAHAGTRATAWHDVLAQASHAGNIFELVGATDPAEILVVHVDDVASEILDRATCIVVAGDWPGSSLLTAALHHGRNAICVGMPLSDGAVAIKELIYEMAHDLPLDAALARIAPAARIAAPTGLIDVTAVGRWASAVGLADARMRNLRYDHEKWGATEVSRMSRASPGGPPRLVVHWAMSAPPDAAPPLADPPAAPAAASEAASQPDESSGPMPDPAPSAPRRRRTAGAARIPREPVDGTEPAPPAASAVPRRGLIGDFMKGGRLVADVLSPGNDYDLVVSIAIPTETQRNRSVPVDETKFPDVGGMTKLTVEVSSEELSLQASTDLYLPTSDRSASSTLAVFPVRVDATESSFAVRILILQEGRPLQAAALIGSIRAQSLPGEAIRLVPVHLSASPEPRPQVTPASVTLETRLGVLRRVGGSDRMAVNVNDVERWLDEAEGIASTFLTADDPPTSLKHAEARGMLVALARCGADLRQTMQKLRVGAASTIAILVESNTRVWPFELAYDGPMPDSEARLCDESDGEHAHAGAPGHASADVVCPWAFWGLSRVLARTFELDEPAPAVDDAPLSLRPVLYAAAARADDGSAAGKGPSHDLERAIKKHAGKSFKRVKTWEPWKSYVQEAQPQLLVLLAHSDTAGGELSLEIGKGAVLTRRDVQPPVVRLGSAPRPLVLLMACSGAAVLDTFGGLPAAFTGGGAAAVIATLSSLRGKQGAQAAAQIVTELHAAGAPEGVTLGTALARARRNLVKSGNLLGLLLVSHGEIDVRLSN